MIAKLPELPHHIIKKSKTWHYDTVRNKYIHKDNLESYVKQLKLKL